MVNGEPITDFDIDQRTKFDILATHKSPDRQAVIDELIDDKIKIKEAKKYSLDLGTSEVDQYYAQRAQAMRLTPEQLTKVLEIKGIRPESFKSQMKAQVVWNKLVIGRFGYPRDGGKEVPAEPKIEGVEYKMQQIILIVPQGSAQTSFQARYKEAETYRGRVQSCDEANSLFRSTPNATIRDSVTKTTLDLPEALRKLLDSTPIGHLTPPEMTRQGIEMVVLCSRTPTMVSTEMNKRVEEARRRKYEEISNAYLRKIRKEAMIEYR